MSLKYILAATLVPSVITVSLVGSTGTVAKVYPDGSIGTLVLPQYLLVAPSVLGATTVYPGGCNDTLVSLSISCWHHLYPSATAVSPGGSPVTLVQLKYLLVTQLVSQCNDIIFGYLLMTPLLPLCYYSISYWPHSYTSVTAVSLGGSTGNVVPLQYILIPSLVH